MCANANTYLSHISSSNVRTHSFGFCVHSTHSAAAFLTCQNHPAVHTVLVLGAFGGRFDQQLGAMNAMYTFIGANPAPHPPPELVFEQASAPSEGEGDGDGVAIAWKPLAAPQDDHDAAAAEKRAGDEFKAAAAVLEAESQQLLLPTLNREFRRMVLVGPSNTAELMLPGYRNIYLCHSDFQGWFTDGFCVVLLCFGDPHALAGRIWGCSSRDHGEAPDKRFYLHLSSRSNGHLPEITSLLVSGRPTCQCHGTWVCVCVCVCVVPRPCCTWNFCHKSFSTTNNRQADFQI